MKRIIKNKISKDEEIKGILKLSYKHKDNTLFNYKEEVSDEFILNKLDIEKLSNIYLDIVKNENYYYSYNHDDIFILSLWLLILSKYQICPELILKYLGE